MPESKQLLGTIHKALMLSLMRVFTINLQTCPDCGGPLRESPCTEDPMLIVKIAMLRDFALLGERLPTGP